MGGENLKVRTKRFALDVIRLVGSLPRGETARLVAGQLLRAATSVGANYRAACRARSAAEFAAKMGIVEEEADECGYWLELLTEAGLVSASTVRSLRNEADELVAISIASIRTARRRPRQSPTMG
jgi:four helix bundle protein